MRAFILLMHNDTISREDGWEAYIQRLTKAGVFQGGSAMGEGLSARKNGQPGNVTAHLAGFIRVSAESLEHAKSLLVGNPVFEAGGTVEIRELPRTD